jgi:hypothetical protein
MRSPFTNKWELQQVDVEMHDIESVSLLTNPFELDDLIGQPFPHAGLQPQRLVTARHEFGPRH